MEFEWDEAKNRRNLAKHWVSFETAKDVFDDPYHLSLRDRTIEGEDRWQTVGMIDGVVVLVAHAYRERGGDATIRIISARKATPGERERYEKGEQQ